MYDRQSAAQAFAGQVSNEAAGTFNLTIIPRPGHSLTELELAADSVFDRIKTDGPTQEELDRVKSGLEFGGVARLEATLNKAETLANGSVFFDDPEAFPEDNRRDRAVTAGRRETRREQISRRMAAWSLSVVPMGKIDQASKPEASVKVGAASTARRHERPSDEHPSTSTHARVACIVALDWSRARTVRAQAISIAPPNRRRRRRSHCACRRGRTRSSRTARSSSSRRSVICRSSRSRSTSSAARASSSRRTKPVSRRSRRR